MKKIAIACPAKPGMRHGNRVTARRWQEILRQLGHQVSIVELPTRDAPRERISHQHDLLIALHAGHSAALIAQSKTRFPERPIVLALTGTDVYAPTNDSDIQDSIRLADRIVVLQAGAKQQLDQRFRSKTHVIHQSSEPVAVVRPANPRRLRVIVAGHLRTVKDPMRVALAVRNLPADSKIEVHHYGDILDEHFRDRVKAETKRNRRYHYFGAIARSSLRQKLARCWLMVLSSKLEGGANVLSESIVQATPVLASRIDGSIGLLGNDYEGYFDVGNTNELRTLLIRCEHESNFYNRLTTQVTRRAKLFQPKAESNAWRKLLSQII